MKKENFLNKVFCLKDTVDYDISSVISKTLINKNVGSITLFSFDEKQALSEHTAPYDAFVYIIEGKAEIGISGKANTLQEGDFIIMPANKPHSVKALENFKMMLVMIRE